MVITLDASGGTHVAILHTVSIRGGGRRESRGDAGHSEELDGRLLRVDGEARGDEDGCQVQQHPGE